MFIFSLVTKILDPQAIFISPLTASAPWTPVFLVGSIAILHFFFHCLWDLDFLYTLYRVLANNKYSIIIKKNL